MYVANAVSASIRKRKIFVLVLCAEGLRESRVSLIKSVDCFLLLYSHSAYHLYTNSTEREVDEILSVKYEDGRWSKPYYDCGGGNIWMLTYTVPFFGYDNGSYSFR